MKQDKDWLALKTNEKGHLLFGGCDTVELAKEYGTPLYVMDESRIRNVCREFKKTFEDQKLNGRILYASKAFANVAMYQIIASEGLGTDVVSAGELYTALKAGMPPERIYMNGNNKTRDEINYAVESGIGRITIDSHEEIDIIADCARAAGKIFPVSLRVKPGIEAHTHDYMTTGTNDSKFGLGVADGEAMKAVQSILSKSSLHFVGLHAHIGSQIFELQPFLMSSAVLADFMQKIRDELGYNIEEINFGGGYGIHYTSEDRPLSPGEYVREITSNFVEQCKQRGLDIPAMVIEPGRAIAGEAGITLYTVGTVKDIPGICCYVSVDGGMGDNPRPALYGAQYTAVLANKSNAELAGTVRLAGRYCESGDVLIRDLLLPPVERGDIVAVVSTGAYSYSMAMQYNRVPTPAVVLANQGKAELMVKRQSIEQLVQNDVIPSWLR